MRNRTSDYGAARVCKGINLRGCEAYATVPNISSSVCLSEITMKGGVWKSDFFGRVVQWMRRGYYVFF